MTNHAIHRLIGLEPDNLLAFMALLGMLRALEEAQPKWWPRVFWTVDELPLRPALQVPATVDKTEILQAISKGLNCLVTQHNFGEHLDLTLAPSEAREKLRQAATGELAYTADLWSALVSDAVIARDGKKVEPTPLCLMFGQGHQHFLSRLASIPRKSAPPERGGGRDKTVISEIDSLREALFEPWIRPDATPSFRWDPHEDVRYALRAQDPTDAKTKETTQHGANRLAAIGISVLTVVPSKRLGKPRLAILGGSRDTDGSFLLGWPIWREPITLAGICALLGHPHLNRIETRRALGIVERRRARRIASGKFMNFTHAGTVFAEIEDQ